MVGFLNWFFVRSLSFVFFMNHRDLTKPNIRIEAGFSGGAHPYYFRYADELGEVLVVSTI
jgi:hypothetical protein